MSWTLFTYGRGGGNVLISSATDCVCVRARVCDGGVRGSFKSNLRDGRLGQDEGCEEEPQGPGKVMFVDC